MNNHFESQNGPKTLKVDFHYAQVIPEIKGSYLSLAQYEPILKKDLLKPDHTGVGRLTVAKHFEMLKRSGRLRDKKQTILVLSTRNVLSNYRCFAFVRDKTTEPVGVVDDILRSKRSFHVLACKEEHVHAIEEFDGCKKVPSSYLWFISGIPVLWDRESGEALFQRIVTEAADHAHVWHIPRGTHPDANENTLRQWEALQRIFKDTLAKSRSEAFAALSREAKSFNLRRESRGVHNIIGITPENSLVQVIGVGSLEDLGREAERLGAVRALCVDNSGSSVVQYSPCNSHSREFIQNIAAPNHRSSGTAYIFLDLGKSNFKIVPRRSPERPQPFDLKDLSSDYVSHVTRLFIDVTREDDPKPLHLDPTSGRIVTKNNHMLHKACFEIDSAIRHLASSNVTLPGSPEHSFVFHPRAKVRTITLLVGLKYFLRTVVDPSDNTRPHRAFPFEASWSQIAISDKEETRKLAVSHLLLLIHATKYSQIGWPKDYLFEFDSAMAAHNALSEFLNKLPGKQDFSPIKNALFHLIRWHTLIGQERRKSSTFGFEELAEKGVAPELGDFLKAFAYADMFLRCGNSANASLVEEVLRSPSAESQLLQSSFAERCVTHCKELVSKEWDSPHEFWNRTRKNAKPGKGTGTSNKLTINSFGRMVTQQAAKPHFPKGAKLSSPNTIIHHSFLRAQVEAGLLSTDPQRKHLNNAKQGELIYSREVRPQRDYRNFGLELSETIFVTTVHPAFIVQHQYDLKLKGRSFCFDNSDPVSSVLDFLSNCFWAAASCGKTISFPLVKRLTDLSAAFNDIAKAGQDIGNKPVFRATFEFDSGTNLARRFDVYLPDIKDDSDLLKIQHSGRNDGFSAAKTIEVLTRYLCTFLTNYGVLANWKTVDIDFSGSSYAKPESISFWHKKMREGMTRLGLHVFQRYLQNTVGGTLSVSHARLQFRRILDPQTVDKPISLPRTSSKYKKSLINKYAIGIDVGATAIKVQFFEIVATSEGKQAAAKIARTVEGGSLYLVRHGEPYFIATRNAGREAYQSARDFANYIFTQLHARMKRQLKPDKIPSILRRTITASVTWPGPILDNHIAGTSGILKMFICQDGKPFTGQIMVDPIERIKEMDLAEALKEEFHSLARKECQGEVLAIKPSVSLVNDGDAEALGTFVSRITEDQTWGNLFSHHPVAIAKAGTGTAGAVLVNGELRGLNEFGKLIIDLAADNSENERKKDANQRFPVGDANKRFSVAFLRKEAQLFGAEGKELEGLDLEILLNDVPPLRVRIDLPQDALLKLGALELCGIAAPNIEYGELNELKPEQTLKYSNDVGFELTEGGTNAHLDDITIFQLATSEKTRGLNIKVGDRMTLISLLEKLGEYRAARIKLHKLREESNWNAVKTIGQRMGQGLAELATLLSDFYGIRALFVSGGPVRGKNIGRACFESLKDHSKFFLADRYFVKRSVASARSGPRPVCQELSSQNIKSKAKELTDCRLWVVHDTDASCAMLGAAIKGVYQYIEDQKIRELEEMKRHADEKDGEKLFFVNRNERQRAYASNSQQT